MRSVDLVIKEYWQWTQEFVTKDVRWYFVQQFELSDFDHPNLDWSRQSQLLQLDWVGHQFDPVWIELDIRIALFWINLGIRIALALGWFGHQNCPSLNWVGHQTCPSLKLIWASDLLQFKIDLGIRIVSTFDWIGHQTCPSLD